MSIFVCLYFHKIPSLIPYRTKVPTVQLIVYIQWKRKWGGGEMQCSSRQRTPLLQFTSLQFLCIGDMSINSMPVGFFQGTKPLPARPQVHKTTNHGYSEQTFKMVLKGWQHEIFCLVFKGIKSTLGQDYTHKGLNWFPFFYQTLTNIFKDL